MTMIPESLGLGDTLAKFFLSASKAGVKISHNALNFVKKKGIPGEICV